MVGTPLDVLPYVRGIQMVLSGYEGYTKGKRRDADLAIREEIFLTLWNRISSEAALIGAISGLGSVIVYGWITTDFATGINYLWLPTNDYGLANLNVFLSALIGSGMVTILISIIRKPKLSTNEE